MSETSKGIILVDMHVLADYGPEVLARMERQHPDIPRLPEQGHYNIEEDYPDHAGQVGRITLQEGFMGSVPEVEGAIAGVGYIIDRGSRVLPFLPDHPFYPSEAEQKGWLEKYLVPEFGYEIIDEAVTGDARKVPGVVGFISDNPAITAEQNAGMRIVFDRPYNQDIGVDLRLHGWKDDIMVGVIYQTRRMPLHLSKTSVANTDS